MKKAGIEKIIDVNTGKFAIRNGRYTLRAMAIGSCVVVAAYDTRAKVAGMAHIMLPGCAPQKSPDNARYAVTAIEKTLNQMFQAGAKAKDIAVCLVGAGNVLKKDDDTICEANIKSVTATLAKKNILVCASVLGGRKRKSVFLNTETGNISYTEGDNQERLLWKPPENGSRRTILKKRVPN